MHKRFVPVLFLAVIVLLQSCQKEVDFSGSNSNNVSGDFRAKIDGSQWVATRGAGASRFSGFINISGIGLDKKTISITLSDSGVHHYTLDDASFNAAAYIDSNLANPINFSTNQGVNPGDAGGTVDITSIDTVNKKISGTFSFKVFRQMDGLQRTMTEGSFTNISYATSLPPASTTDTFRVKIAGSSWTPSSITGISMPNPPVPSLAIVASDALGVKSVGITMPPTITPGTYTLDILGAQYIGLYNPDSDPNHSQASTSGTLTILEHNTSTKRIRGNFNFHAEAILNPLLNTELTEGYFSVRYQ